MTAFELPLLTGFPDAPLAQKSHLDICLDRLSTMSNGKVTNDISFLFTIVPIHSNGDYEYQRDGVGNLTPIISRDSPKTTYIIDPNNNDPAVFRWESGHITQAEGYNFFQGETHNGIQNYYGEEMTPLSDKTRTIFSSCHDLNLLTAEGDGFHKRMAYAGVQHDPEYDGSDEPIDLCSDEPIELRRPVFKPDNEFRSLAILQRYPKDMAEYNFVLNPNPCCIPAYLPSNLQPCIRSARNRRILDDQYIHGDLGILLGIMMYSVHAEEIVGEGNMPISHNEIMRRIFVQGQDGRLPKWYRGVWTDMSMADGYITTEVESMRGYVVYFSMDGEGNLCDENTVRGLWDESKSAKPFIYMRRDGFKSHRDHVENP